MNIAIDKLIIYVDETKYIFPEITKIPTKYYILDRVYKLPKYEFDNNKPLFYTIKNMINNNKFFNKDKFSLFNKKFKYLIYKEKSFDTK